MKVITFFCSWALILLVGIVSAGLQDLQCDQTSQPFDLKDYFAKKGITDPEAHCSTVIANVTCGTPDEKKSCDKANQMAHKVKHLMEQVSERLAKEPCASTPEKEKEAKKKVDEIIDKLNKKSGGDPDPGTFPNPADSCKQLLLAGKPEGKYWVWNNGKAVEKMCKKGELGTQTNPADSCAELLVEDQKPEGEYWIHDKDGNPKKVMCKKGPPGSENNPAKSCDEILSDLSKPEGKYYILKNGKSVEKNCKRGEPGTKNNPAKSCDEILSDLSKPERKYYILEGGKSVEKECKRGDPGTKNNPAKSCDEILSDLSKPEGKYYILEGGKSVEKDCKQGDLGTKNNPAKLCDEILSDLSKPEGKYYILEGGKSVEKNCKRGEPGTKNNPAKSCDEILKDPSKNEGTYWILVNGKRQQKECKQQTAVNENTIKFSVPEFGKLQNNVKGEIRALDSKGKLDTKGNYEGDLKVTVDPIPPSSCSPVSATVTNRNDGTYGILFKVSCSSKYNVKVTFKGKDIQESPKEIDIRDFDYTQLKEGETKTLPDHCTPQYLNTAPDGSLLVSCDTFVLVLDPSLKLIKKVDGFGSVGVASIMDGRLYIPDLEVGSNTITVLDIQTYKELEVISMFDRPSVIGANSDEKLLYIGEYVTRNIYSYDPATKERTLLFEAGFTPVGLAMNFDGQLSVLASKKTIKHYNLSDKTGVEYGHKGLIKAKGLTRDRAGNIVAANNLKKKSAPCFVVFNSEYEYVTGIGEANHCSDITFADGTSLWVASRAGLTKYTL